MHYNQPGPRTSPPSNNAISADEVGKQDSNDTIGSTGGTVNATPIEYMPAKAVIREKPLIVTEYMLRDWRKFGGGLPQWIEIYNPNSKPVGLSG